MGWPAAWNLSPVCAQALPSPGLLGLGTTGLGDGRRLVFKSASPYLFQLLKVQAERRKLGRSRRGEKLGFDLGSPLANSDSGKPLNLAFLQSSNL